MEPLVSVSCITFNHQEFFRECLDGILMQETSFDFEILIHDDASTDGTTQIIMEYKAKFPDIIKPLIQEVNQYSNGVRGINATFNYPRAQGKYIALCEGDDYWTDPYKLQKQVDFLEANPEFNLVGHYSYSLNVNSGKKTLIGKHAQDRYSHEEIAYRNLRIPTSSLIFRNNLVFSDWIFKVYGGDRALIYLNSIEGDLKILDFIGSVYRIHEGGVESQLKQNKLNLPKRNIKEDYIYYRINSIPAIRWKLYKKIMWNQFYLLYWSIRSVDIKEIQKTLTSISKFLLFQKI